MITLRVSREAPTGRPLSAEVVEFDYKTMDPREYENRNDWKSYQEVETLARLLGPGYIATDAGAHVSPRYDVKALPKVGDLVSYAFNGDSYPCGKITKISSGPGFKRIETEEILGNGAVRKEVFWRRRLSGSWINRGTWSLVHGHVSKRNPEF